MHASACPVKSHAPKAIPLCRRLERDRSVKRVESIALCFAVVFFCSCILYFFSPMLPGRRTPKLCLILPCMVFAAALDHVASLRAPALRPAVSKQIPRARQRLINQPRIGGPFDRDGAVGPSVTAAVRAPGSDQHPGTSGRQFAAGPPFKTFARRRSTPRRPIRCWCLNHVSCHFPDSAKSPDSEQILPRDGVSQLLNTPTPQSWPPPAGPLSDGRFRRPNLRNVPFSSAAGAPLWWRRAPAPPS